MWDSFDQLPHMCICLTMQGYFPCVGWLLHCMVTRSHGKSWQHQMCSTVDRKTGLHTLSKWNSNFASNDVNDSTKWRVLLLSFCWAVTYKLICEFVAPDKLTDRSYMELDELVEGHYNPMQSPIVQQIHAYQPHAPTRQERCHLCHWPVSAHRALYIWSYAGWQTCCAIDWSAALVMAKSSAAYWPNRISCLRKLSSWCRWWRQLRIREPTSQ